MLEIEGADQGTQPVVARGSTIAVRGVHFVAGCDDGGTSTEVGGVGCSSSPADVERPLDDIELTLRQGSKIWALGTADAGVAADNEMGQVEWALALPRAVDPGHAVLRAEYATETLAIRVT